MRVLAVVAAVVIAVLTVLRHRVFVVRVRGRSMAPTYRDGERIVMVRGGRVRPGDVVAFRPPDRAGALAAPAERDRPMVKRVVAIGEAAHLRVRGDAPRSLDSTVFGPVPPHLVIGRGVRGLVRSPR